MGVLWSRAETMDVLAARLSRTALIVYFPVIVNLVEAVSYTWL